MEHIKGGVTAAKGFMAAGVEANVKYKNRKDMAMVYSQVPCKGVLPARRWYGIGKKLIPPPIFRPWW